MLNSIYFTLLSNVAMLSSDNFFSALGISVFVGLFIAIILLSKSRTKMKATKAKDYISVQLQLTEQSDVYTHTTTSRRKINN